MKRRGFLMSLLAAPVAAIVPAQGRAEVAVFTSPGTVTWTKPSKGNVALIEVWGAGGVRSGGGGSTGYSRA